MTTPSTCFQNRLWAAKLSYLLNCFSGAAIWNFIAVFYQQTGFSKGQIGILQSIPPLCFIIGAPLWGAVADYLQRQRAVHVFTIVSGSVLMFSLRYISSYWLMLVMVTLACLQQAPIGSLLDQAVLSLLDQVGGEYGKQRLYGGIGYGLGAYLTGQIVTALELNWMFNVHIISAFLSIYILTFLPSGKVAAPGENASLMHGLRQLKQKKDVLCLFLLVFILGLIFGCIASYLTLYLFNLSNGDARIVGVSIFCETTSELPAFFYADAIVKKLGTTGVLLLSIIGWGIRLFYYSIMTNAWSVLPFEFLHGVTFSLMWAACTNYTYRACTPGTEGTMMGLLSSMLNGVGKLMGTLIGGYLYSAYGAVTMWRLMGLSIPLSLIALYFFDRLSKQAGCYVVEKDLLIESSGMVSPATPSRTYERTPRSGDRERLFEPQQEP